MHTASRVYIIGFMGSGKTTAGKKISAFLGWDFVDLDHMIEMREKKSVNEIFSLYGEDYFRELESTTLKNLETVRNTVISAGGGTPCYCDNMEFMLRTGTVVYLKMTPGQLVSRLEKGLEKRPLLKEKDNKELLHYITNKLSERENYYEAANITVDSINLDIRSLCDKIRR